MCFYTPIHYYKEVNLKSLRNSSKNVELSNEKTVFFCLARGYSTFRKHKYFKLVVRNLFINRHLWKYSNAQSWIFHEGNISKIDQFLIHFFSKNFKIRFISISNIFKLDSDLIWTNSSNYGLGYSLMCRFSYLQIWSFIKDFDVAIRVDDDVLVIDLDVLAPDALYSCAKLYPETHEKTNLSFYKFLEAKCLEKHYDDNFPPNCFYLSRPSFWMQEQVSAYLYDVSISPLSLEDRWGDTVVMGVALKEYAESDQVLVNNKISYAHLSHNLLLENGIESVVGKTRLEIYSHLVKLYFKASK